MRLKPLSSTLSRQTGSFNSRQADSGQRKPTVSAGVAAASVAPLLAVGAHEAGRAAAAVAAGHVLLAGSSVETWPVRARHGADLAVLPVEALRAGARVVIDQVLRRKRGEAG